MLITKVSNTMTLLQPLSLSFLLLITSGNIWIPISLATTHVIPKVDISWSSLKPEEPLSDSPWWLNPYENPVYGLQPGSGPYVPPQFIDLGHSVMTNGPPCATMLTTSNCIVQVPDDASHKNILERQFTFATGLISDQCSLTIQDCTGSLSSFTNYLFHSNEGACDRIASVCCECHGCNRPSSTHSRNANSCAILFEHERCSLCNGFRLEVGHGDKVERMNGLVDNKVSSIYVEPGCELKVFQDSEFQGYAAVAQGSLDLLPFDWNDRISSFNCECVGDQHKSPEPVHELTTVSLKEITTVGAEEKITTMLSSATESIAASSPENSIDSTTTESEFDIETDTILRKDFLPNIIY